MTDISDMLTTPTMEVTVNGEQVIAEIEPRLLLVHLLRDHLDLTGTHWGCDTSNCGACTVWLDGKPAKSCTMLAAMADGHEVRTVEDLEGADGLDPVQQGFVECHGLQCGFCTPGMMMTGRALLDENPDPSEPEIREAISGNLCRCTGYENIVRSIRWAAATEAETRRTSESEADYDRDETPTPRESVSVASTARRMPASSGARATTSTTSSCPACCTAPCFAAPWRTLGSCPSTPRPPRRTRG